MNRPDLASDLGFCCSLTFIVLQCFSFSRGLFADSWILGCESLAVLTSARVTFAGLW